MSEVKWTKEQQQAIYEKDSNILVAAAAGSGKTAVLVERIINKIINENVDIDKLLVVTFTNAAASEMRERVLNAIYKKLDEDPENTKLQRQITLLNKASICTIDSFCLEIVRNNFYELENISPNFRIADTTEIELLKQETIEEIFEKKYEEQDEDFTKLINTYTSYRDDTPLKELILKIYTYIQSSPFPEKWLSEKIEMFNLEDKLDQDFSKTPWGEELLKELEEELIDDITSLQDVQESLSYEPDLDKFEQTIRSDIDMLQALINAINNWDKCYEISKNVSFITWPRKKVESEIKDEAKAIRDDIKKKLNKKLEKILVSDSKEANQDIYDMYQILLKLQNMILEFTQEFSKKKRDKNIVDFNDIEHLALKVLIKENEDGTIEKTEVAKKYQNKFVEIAIDEYQDSNLVQEYILTSVSNGANMFMVGDVKQSIYKFRQAMPELFLNKYATYKNKDNKTENENLKIQLFKNFRSRDNVLEFTNLIFEDIMSNVLGDIEYNEEEFLNLGASYEEINQNLKTEIDIINLKETENPDNRETENSDNKETENPDDKKTENTLEQEKARIEKQSINSENIEDQDEETQEKIEDIELEARFVANRIKQLIDSKYQVFDRKTNGFRNIQYKDIVILLRSTKTASPIFEQEVLNLDMPIFSDTSQEYLDSIEIQTIMSLLRIIDNPIQDIPLVTVMRSNIGKFTDDELVEIRLADKYDNFYICMQKSKANVRPELKEKIEKFLNNLNKWREEQEYLALDELIWKIYSDTGYYNYVGLMPNGELRQANLKMLFERAKQYETASFKGLYNFINFIEKLRLSSGDLGSAKLIGENDNVIRIMSIHKSKGLEFPVVFLSSTGKQFNLLDLNQNVLLHQEMGIGAKYIDYEMQVQYDTLTKAAIRSKIFTETLSEEMRILYVALTRAKEKLIITGLSKDYQKEIEKMQEQQGRYSKCGQKINPILVKKYKKYLDWIMLVYLYEKAHTENLIDWKVLSKKEIMQSFKKVEKEEVDVIKLLDNYEENEANEKEIKKILDYEYPNKLATTIPTKTSVTKIKQMKNSNNEEVTTKVNSLFDKPKFLKNQEEQKITNAQKGTLVHLCMQKLDEKVEYDLNKIKELIIGLENKEIITHKEAESINPYKILEFTKSTIWQELKQAKEVYKEKPFYINIPAKDLYLTEKEKLNEQEKSDIQEKQNQQEEVTEKILVQGIIDLYYIDKDDKLVLLDYKTDYIEKGREIELLNKYSQQLGLYKKALESAIKRKVDRIFIYSVYLGREIEVNIHGSA